MKFVHPVATLNLLSIWTMPSVLKLALFIYLFIVLGFA